jgi:hypothetical protein
MYPVSCNELYIIHWNVAVTRARRGLQEARTEAGPDVTPELDSYEATRNSQTLSR